ncbi:hypothetical protein EYR38_008197 [Pleurotus pulmonarius]|nr:hypothetical protein EYR38_008197 [Pleurotus pulmonarius]
MPDSHSNAPPSNVRRLEYLRSIELIHIFHPLLGLKTFIECPNLVRFYVGWSELDPTRWDFPPWIPARLSELGLQTNLYSHTPRFGASIQPSEVKIEIHGQEGPPPPYSAFLPRIRACLNHLHFPHLIQTLTINIMSYEDDGRDCLYPKLSDYEALSEFFQQLRGCEGGKLKAIFLNIKMESQVDEGSIGDRPASDLEWLEDGGPTEHDESSNVDFPNNELHVDEARETAKLQQGFAELLKDNMLNVEFTLERLSIWGGASKVLTHCSIRTM